jgi:hypothetical protein
MWESFSEVEKSPLPSRSYFSYLRTINVEAQRAPKPVPTAPQYNRKPEKPFKCKRKSEKRNQTLIRQHRTSTQSQRYEINPT